MRYYNLWYFFQREKIADDVHEYNTRLDDSYPDVSTWDIKTIPMAKQTDG